MECKFKKTNLIMQFQYWGGKQSAKNRQRAKKLTPMDQLFMTLVKLRLDLKVVDIAFHFNISTALVSRYFTTWMFFVSSFKGNRLDA